MVRVFNPSLWTDLFFGAHYSCLLSFQGDTGGEGGRKAPMINKQIYEYRAVSLDDDDPNFLARPNTRQPSHPSSLNLTHNAEPLPCSSQNSNLVLTTDQRHSRNDEPSGEVETLHGKMTG